MPPAATPMPALAPVLSPSEPEVDPLVPSAPVDPLVPSAPVWNGPAPEPDGEDPSERGNVFVVLDEAVVGEETVGDGRGVVAGVVFEPCYSQHRTDLHGPSPNLKTHSAADYLHEWGIICAGPVRNHKGI
jgi:hypothetical protein